MLALAAIEAHANDAIARLPEDALVEVPMRLGGKTVPVMRDQAAMDRLPLSEKVTRAVPLLTGRPSIKATRAWQPSGATTRTSRARSDVYSSVKDRVAQKMLPSLSRCWNLARFPCRCAGNCFPTSKVCSSRRKHAGFVRRQHSRRSDTPSGQVNDKGGPPEHRPGDCRTSVPAAPKPRRGTSTSSSTR
jgi:hypothetical protein